MDALHWPTTSPRFGLAMETLTGMGGLASRVAKEGHNGESFLLLMGPPHPHVRVNLPPSLVVLVVHTHSMGSAWLGSAWLGPPPSLPATHTTTCEAWRRINT